MQITELFYSIDGEGTRTGLPVIFIRSFGCNMLCSYCDSHYAVLPSCTKTEIKEMSACEILDTIKQWPCKRVTLTGGEPLLQRDCYTLIKMLLEEQYEVNVETNGSINPYQVNPFNKEIMSYPYLYSDKLFFTFDYKCPSSGQEKKMDTTVLVDMEKRDVLKFVVGSTEDLYRAEQVIAEYRPNGQVYISPVFGKIEPKEIVEFIKDSEILRNADARMQLQLHKFIWPANMIGV